HEPALVVHETVEVATGAGEALPEVVGRRLQEFGADRVADPEDVAKDIGQALLSIETQQHARGAADPRFVDENPEVRGNAAWIRETQIRRRIETVRVAVEACRGWFGAPAFHGEHVVDDDTIEPGPEATPTLERREPGERLDQDFLGRVLGVLRMA